MKPARTDKLTPAGAVGGRAGGLIGRLRRRLAAAERRVVRQFLAGRPIVQLQRQEGLGYPALRGLLERHIGAEAYAEQCRRNEAAGRAKGMAGRGVRPWTAEEEELLRRDYRRRPGRELAAELDRPLHQVRGKAKRMGLAVPQRIKAPGFEAFLRARNAEGWSDSEIAAARGADRHGVTGMRRRLGLPSNATSNRVRAKIAAAAARQCRREGVASLGALRVEVFRRRARAAGWPEDLRPRAVQMLELLFDRGPQTRRQIAAAIGMPWKGSRASLASNDPEGSYLAHLMARGLVICLGRVARDHETGSTVCVYSLPLTIERSTG